MAANSRSSLIKYCLRDLGHPVITINVTEEQLEDRLDEALEYFAMYHYEGVEKMYLTHKITCSSLNIQETNAASYIEGNTIVGATSGAIALIQRNINQDSIRIRNVVGQFLAGEVVSSAGITSTLTSSDFYVAGDTENGWIPIPDIVYGVSRVLPMRMMGSGDYIFDLQYQMTLNGMHNLLTSNLTYYHQTMAHLSLIDFELNTRPDFEFNRLQSRLRLDVNWRTKIETDMYIVLECHRALDPIAFVKVFNEPLLKKYTTALIKRQWATNLKKFSGMQLPGGVVIDGKQLYIEANQEISDIEDDISSKSAPLGFMMG